MKASLVEWLRCPACGNEDLELEISSEREGEIESGKLGCLSCHERFPIVRSIPRFVPSDNYANTFGFQWNRFKLTQFDSHSRTSISRDRLLEQTRWSDEMLNGATVVDAGCGAGRFAEIALDMGAEVFALDYSNAVDACWENLGPHPNLHLLQADILALPLKQTSFDYVYSFGVLMHLPEPQASFDSLVPLLKAPDGRIVVDVYGKSWMTRLNTKYWIRPITKRLPMGFMFRVIQIGVPLILPIIHLLERIPLVGKLIQRAVPIADYKGMYPLDKAQLREWAILDTFDMLTPTYDRPILPRELREWFENAQLDEIEIFKLHHLVGRGRKH